MFGRTGRALPVSQIRQLNCLLNMPSSGSRTAGHSTHAWRWDFLFFVLFFVVEIFHQIGTSLCYESEMCKIY